MSTDNNLSQFNKHPRKKKAPGRKRSGAGNLFAAILVIVIFLSLLFAVREMLQTRSIEELSPADAFQALNDPSISARAYVSGQCIYYDNSEVPPERDDIWVMYNLLNDADKQVYNLFMDLVEHRCGENYTNEIIISQQQLNQLEHDHLWNIYYAMLYDHPEYFFLQCSPDMIDCHYITTGNYYTYIYMIKAENEAETKQITAFNAATDEFMRDIDLSLSDEEKELAIHDKLLSLVTYNYDLYEKYEQEESMYDLGYSAYGALVCVSSGAPNSAVCNGYALAFEHLCHEAGIPCCIISGNATHIPPSPEQVEGDHAWNIVNIDGRWYEVDPTWDDFDYHESIDISVYEALQQNSEKFYNRLHHYYNRSTAEMEYLKATDDTVFSLEGYLPYNIVTDSSHIRDTNYTGTSDDVEVFRNRLIPVAE